MQKIIKYLFDIASNFTSFSESTLLNVLVTILSIIITILFIYEIRKADREERILLKWSLILSFILAIAVILLYASSAFIKVCEVDSQIESYRNELEQVKFNALDKYGSESLEYQLLLNRNTMETYKLMDCQTRKKAFEQARKKLSLEKERLGI